MLLRKSPSCCVTDSEKGVIDPFVQIGTVGLDVSPDHVERVICAFDLFDVPDIPCAVLILKLL